MILAYSDNSSSIALQFPSHKASALHSLLLSYIISFSSRFTFISWFISLTRLPSLLLCRCCFIRCKTLYDMVTENIPYISSHTSQFAELVRNLSCLFPKGIMQFRCFFGLSAFFNWEMASYLSVLRQILCRRKPRNRYSKRNLYASSGRISVQIRCHEQR